MVINKVPSKLLEHWNLIKFTNAKILEKALANYLGQLHQGIGLKTTKGKIPVFIHLRNIPHAWKGMYIKLMASLQPLKTEVH